MLRWQPIDQNLLAKIKSDFGTTLISVPNHLSVSGEYCRPSLFGEVPLCRLKFEGVEETDLTHPAEQKLRGKEGALVSYFFYLENTKQDTRFLPMDTAEEDMVQLAMQAFRAKIHQAELTEFIDFYFTVAFNSERGKVKIFDSLSGFDHHFPNTPEEIRNDVANSLRYIFDLTDDMQIVNSSSAEAYPVFGEVFRTTLPAIFDGRLWWLSFLVSQDGNLQVLSANPSRIEIRDQDMPGERRLPLRLKPTAAMVSLGLIYRRNLDILLLDQLGRTATILQVPILLFALASLFTVLFMGFGNANLKVFVESLGAHHWLAVMTTVVSTLFILGALGTWIATILNGVTSGKIPTRLQKAYAKFDIIQKSSFRLNFEKWGRAGRIVGTTLLLLNLFLTFLAAAALFVFGVGNLMPGTIFPQLDLIEAALLVILSVPMLGPSLGWVFDIGDSIGLYEVSRNEILMYASSFVVITLGLQPFADRWIWKNPLEK